MRGAAATVILERLNRMGSVSVAAEPSEELRVSDMTIPPDRKELSSRRLLERVHGGTSPQDHR
ncbi:MAG: hypothetical protein CYG60_25015 [Actinobacteria bacterium]|nr:DeoR family transcriptional regulator [Actinomycetota bacterium]PLS82185.1 MAG: hypothetical protein CYG60_25015 [Actinomycetota bacterium]